MKKYFFLFVFLGSFCFAKDTSLLIKQKNALYIQNMIELEEKIAQEFERYLLNEFKVPSIDDLISKKYLPSNFSKKNMMGSEIEIKSTNPIRLKFAITRKTQSYLVALYKRDLYRYRTTVKTSYDQGKINLNSSYVQITLKSQEAQNIYNLLKNAKTINKNCLGDKINVYCSQNKNSIRYYYSNNSWIEYSKKLMNLGNVTVKNVSLENNSLLSNLAIGRYIFVENKSKYIKLYNNEIKKVQ